MFFVPLVKIAKEKICFFTYIFVSLRPIRVFKGEIKLKNMIKFVDFIKKSKFFNIEHVFVCLIVLLFAGILAFLSLNLTLFSPFKQAYEEFSITDVYHTIQRTGKKVTWSNDITIVDVTEQHNRSEIANTIKEVSLCKPKAIMVDLIFSAPSMNFEDDDSLMRVVSDIPNIIFGKKLVDYNEDANKFTGEVKSFFSDDVDAPEGYVNVLKNINNGLLREYTISECLNNDTVPSIAWLSANEYKGEKNVYSNPNERLIVYSDISFPKVRYDSISHFNALLKDRLVIVGALKEEADMHLTPIGKMGGSEIQAYITQTCIDHDNVRTSSFWVTIILAIILCYLSAWIGYLIMKKFPLMYLYWLQGYYFLLSALLVWIGFILFVKYDYYMKMTIPFLGFALVEQARLHYKWIISYGNAHPKKKWLNKLTKKSIYSKTS